MALRSQQFSSESSLVPFVKTTSNRQLAIPGGRAEEGKGNVLTMRRIFKKTFNRKFKTKLSER